MSNVQAQLTTQDPLITGATISSARHPGRISGHRHKSAHANAQLPQNDGLSKRGEPKS
jgi:hypothetical protein